MEIVYAKELTLQEILFDFGAFPPAIAQRSKLLLRFRSHRHSAYFYGRCAVSQPFQAAGAFFRLSEGLGGIFTITVQGFNCLEGCFQKLLSLS